MGRKLFCSALVALAVSVQGPAASGGQTGAPARSPGGADSEASSTFRGGIDLVALTVTVTNTDQEFVDGLGASDFAVYENGVQQPIAFFAASDAPLDLAILVDASASMADRLNLVRQSADGLVDTLRPGDRAAVVEFQNTVMMAQAMTADLPAVREAIARVTARGGTALHEALYVTLSELSGAGAGDIVRRRAIVVLSDGLDTRSLVTSEQVLERARHAGVTVYLVALRTEAQEEEAGGNYSPATFELRRLAVETGGRAFFPVEPKEIRGIYDLIGEELSSQYALGYVPPRPQREGEWRTVHVRVPGQGSLEPRTRAGYFAAGAGSSRRTAGRGGGR